MIRRLDLRKLRGILSRDVDSAGTEPCTNDLDSCRPVERIARLEALLGLPSQSKKIIAGPETHHKVSNRSVGRPIKAALSKGDRNRLSQGNGNSSDAAQENIEPMVKSSAIRSPALQNPQTTLALRFVSTPNCSAYEQAAQAAVQAMFTQDISDGLHLVDDFPSLAPFHVTRPTSEVSVFDDLPPLPDKGVRRTLFSYAGRLIPIILSQPASLPSIQTLLHFAAQCIHDERFEWFAAVVAAAVGGFRALSSMSGVTGICNTNNAQTSWTWIIMEEARRTAWIVGLFDRMLAAWHNCPSGIAYEEIAGLHLPAHDSLWFGESPETDTGSVPLNYPVHLLSASGSPIPGPTLENFYDEETWPISQTRALPVGRQALAAALEVFCMGKILEFVDNTALVEAVTLNSEALDATATWYSRFHASLNVPQPGTPTTNANGSQPQLPHPDIAALPWALMLFIQYHFLSAYWNAPLAPLNVNRGGGSNGTFGVTGSTAELGNPEGTNPKSFIAAWMGSPAFVTCLDRSRDGLTALHVFMEIHGDGLLAHYASGAWGFSLGMSTITILFAIQEVLRSTSSAKASNLNSLDDTSGAENSPLGHRRVAMEFIMQTRLQIATAIRALRALGRTWNRGLGAAHLIERLHTAIIQDPVNSDRLLTWVAERQSEIFLHLAAAASGRRELPPSLAPSDKPNTNCEAAAIGGPELFEADGMLGAGLEQLSGSEEMVDIALARVAEMTSGLSIN
ncbi:hypothetical protein HDU93_008990 [Gonapodya sp. JEL0774]|nr:hypothetical protein HDU93_008990 [Gonapodya sp. JEL0774]